MKCKEGIQKRLLWEGQVLTKTNAISETRTNPTNNACHPYLFLEHTETIYFQYITLLYLGKKCPSWNKQQKHTVVTRTLTPSTTKTKRERNSSNCKTRGHSAGPLTHINSQQSSRSSSFSTCPVSILAPLSARYCRGHWETALATEDVSTAVSLRG